MKTPRGLVVMALLSRGAVAQAHQAQPQYPSLRPTLEVSPWVALGGGALVATDATTAVFDLRIGGDFTGAIGRHDDLRLGPFVEVGTSTFASVQAIGGAELFVAAIPRPLRMFLYSGEGVLSLRVGAGWAWRASSLTARDNAPVASVTVAYGYRAPFSLREPGSTWSPKPEDRPTARYMTGVRLWVNATVDLRDAPAWQLTGGIEFEPVGSFRYLLGLY